jgi:hypothetical protein
MKYEEIEMRHLQSLLFFSILLGCPSFSQAQQLWSGIISPSRATDWTQAGIPGGLPDGNWTQCGSTIAAYTGTAAAISARIQSCKTNQYVLLGPGTFNLTSEIQFGGRSHVVLRGSGANSTFIVYTGAVTPVVGCNTGFSALVGMCGADQSNQVGNTPAHIYNWTAGYAQGSTQITLSSTANISTLSSGTPTFLFLNQDSDGYTGFPATGSSVDNGNYFVCADIYSGAGPTGCSVEGPVGTPKGNLVQRWQYEIAVPTAKSGNVVTISPPLKHPNWRSSQNPIVWLTQPMVQSGIENLSIDASGANALDVIDIMACYQCWVSGLRILNTNTRGINVFWSAHIQIQNNYFYNATTVDPYAIRFQTTADNLVQNNIIQKIRSAIVFDMPDAGTVVAYNYIINSATPSDTMWPSFWLHSAMDDFELFEGNVAYGFDFDYFHGSHLNTTLFRNFSTGWESCANGQCGTLPRKDSYTIPVNYSAYNRYGNIVGNVLGTPGYHTTYQASYGSLIIYALGTPDNQVPADPLTASTMMRWGNYDAVTAAANAGNGTRWCGSSSDTGWSTICAGTSEIPSGINPYPNALPTVGDIGAGQSALPASFYLLSKPAWFGSAPWPAIGPDVSGGTVGLCSGALNTPGHFSGLPATSSSQCKGTSLTTGWAGHVNAIPAMNCALNVMGMPPDGTGGPFPFNAASCYSEGSALEGPSAPTNLQAITQ